MEKGERQFIHTALASRGVLPVNIGGVFPVEPDLCELNEERVPDHEAHEHSKEGERGLDKTKETAEDGKGEKAPDRGYCSCTEYQQRLGLLL